MFSNTVPKLMVAAADDGDVRSILLSSAFERPLAVNRCALWLIYASFNTLLICLFDISFLICLFLDVFMSLLIYIFDMSLMPFLIFPL